jgi:hypothetical protein
VELSSAFFTRERDGEIWRESNGRRFILRKSFPGSCGLCFICYFILSLPWYEAVSLLPRVGLSRETLGIEIALESVHLHLYSESTAEREFPHWPVEQK